MTAFADLDPMPGFSPDPDTLRAVGWLSADRPFPTGPSSQAFVDRLKALIGSAFQPVQSMGFHECDLCQFDGALGTANLFLPGDGLLYVCPELIVHYISTHHYQPPSEFVNAVLAAPDAASMDFRKAFLGNGGRAIIRGFG